jgi:TetR/AcrR family transcriptional regulator
MASTKSKVLLTHRNPDRTKGRLLKAAIRLFSARGFHGVSVDEIVAAARVNKRMVYHYFGSKGGIYAAALVDVFKRLESVEFSATTISARPDEKLRKLLETNFRFLDNNPEFVRMLLWENLEQGENILRNASQLNKNPFIERFQTIIEEGIAQGLFRAPCDIKHLLVNFIGLCFIYYSNRYSLSASLGLDLDNERERKMRLRQAVDLVFHGLLASETGEPRPPPSKAH